MKSVITGLTIFTVIIFACSKKSSDNEFKPDCSTPKSFATDVNPIIQASCAITNCHASGSTNGPGPLTNYTQISNAAHLIRPAVSSGFMPQNSSLTDAQKSAIICWIDSGAHDN